MNDLKLDLQKIFRETTETLLNPKEYFSSMSLEGGYIEPIIKAAIYGVVAGLFSLLWSLLGFSPMGGGGIWGGAVGVMALIWSVVGAIATAFIGGALMAVISIICGGNRDLEANVRVAASLMAVYPIRAFLAFTYGISFALDKHAEDVFAKKLNDEQRDLAEGLFRCLTERASQHQDDRESF